MIDTAENVTTNPNFIDIDEALDRLERPYYRSCSGGAYFEITPEWTRERDRLTKLWYELNPRTVKARTNKSCIDVLKSWLKLGKTS